MNKSEINEQWLTQQITKELLAFGAKHELPDPTEDEVKENVEWFLAYLEAENLRDLSTSELAREVLNGINRPNPKEWLEEQLEELDDEELDEWCLCIKNDIASHFGV